MISRVGEVRAVRIRGLHAACGPRAFRASFRNTEARRETSQGCGEESTQTGPETEAAFFPRFKRPTLKSFRCRFSHLPGDLGISQPLSYNLGNCKAETVSIVHCV